MQVEHEREKPVSHAHAVFLEIEKAEFLDGSGARGGTGVLKVDGKEVASEKLERTVPFLLQWDETFDIGSDTGTGVDDRDYQVPFALTGKIVKLNIKVDRPKLSEADIKLLETESQRNNHASE